MSSDSIHRLVRVNIPRQQVEVVEEGDVIWSAPVSTSKFGLGEESGSFKTPRGKFSIAEKIGDGEPLGRVFKSRVSTDQIWNAGENSDEDLILTRILWLQGDEPENASTHERYIYFHGTNHEGEMGLAASHGCIRLRNKDILELFDLVEVGTKVEISANTYREDLL